MLIRWHHFRALSTLEQMNHYDKKHTHTQTHTKHFFSVLLKFLSIKMRQVIIYDEFRNSFVLCTLLYILDPCVDLKM